MIEAWRAQIKEVAARRARLVLRGGGSKETLGEFESAVGASMLDTRPYSGIVAYEPEELVMTARCGTPLADVEQVMRDAGQMLAFEAPFASTGATIGGVVASGMSGPRRPYSGAVRDFVLGVKLIDGKGDHLSFGGQVMKNVAGFDVARLQCGAWGTLGLLTEVSFKCLPLPKSETTLRFEIDSLSAVEKMNAWAATPLPISGAAWHEGVMRIRLSGAASAVSSAKDKLGGEAGDDTAWWSALRDGEIRVSDDGSNAPLWRVSVRPTAPLMIASGMNLPTLLDWGGGQRYVRVPVKDAAIVRAWAEAQGGHAQLLCQQAQGVSRFHPLAPPLLAIHQRLKETFDPYRIFNIGRMYAAF